MTKRALMHTQPRAANVTIITERGAGIQFIVPEETARLVVFVLYYVTAQWALAYVWRAIEWAWREAVVWREVFSPVGWRRDLILMGIVALTLLGVDRRI